MSTTIHVLPHSQLSREQRDLIVRVCSEAYEEDFAPYFGLLRDAVHVLALEGEQLVSHGAWVPRELRVGAARTRLRCAYVEAIATPVHLQRRGFGSFLLRSMPPLLHDYDIAALSPSESGFYARLGWEMWQGPLQYLRDGRVVQTPEEEVMIHRLPKTPVDLNTDAVLEIDWREGEVW